MKDIYYLCVVMAFIFVAMICFSDAFWYAGGLRNYWRDNWIEQPTFWIGLLSAVFAGCNAVLLIFKVTFGVQNEKVEKAHGV